MNTKNDKSNPDELIDQQKASKIANESKRIQPIKSEAEASKFSLSGIFKTILLKILSEETIEIIDETRNDINEVVRLKSLIDKRFKSRDSREIVISRPQTVNFEINQYALRKLVDSGEEIIRIFTKTCSKSAISKIETNLIEWLNSDKKRSLSVITQELSDDRVFNHERIKKVIYSPNSKLIADSYFNKVRADNENRCAIRAIMIDDKAYKLTFIDPPNSKAVLSFSDKEFTGQLNIAFDEVMEKLTEELENRAA